jgi:phosphohistidine phosphatase SixA
MMKTVILLRHADIDPPPGPAPIDWPLNTAGQARAQTLVHVAGSAGVTEIFVSDALRTQQTVAPLTAKLGLQPKEAASTQEVIHELLAGSASDVVLVAGHSDTVPEIINGLGAVFPGPAIQGHDDQFLVAVAAGSASAVRLKYGPATP